MKRRQFVLTTASAVTIGVAGCLGGGDGDTDSPEAAVEAWYELEANAGGRNVSDLQDDAEELLHSESPILQSLRALGQEQNETDEQNVSVDSIETTLVEENLSESDLEAEFPFLFNNPESEFAINDEAKAAIAEENTLVEASVERSGANVSEEEQSITDQWLTATENGDWQLVISRNPR